MPHQISQISVRPATSDDVPRLCALLALLFTQEADFQPNSEKQSRALRLIMDQPEFGQIFCAINGESLIGMVSLLFTPGITSAGPAAWLEDLIVDPEWRGRGIGSLLLRESIRHAESVGCTRITLLTDAINLSAIRFYERAGFLCTRSIPWRRR